MCSCWPIDKCTVKNISLCSVLAAEKHVILFSQYFKHDHLLFSANRQYKLVWTDIRWLVSSSYSQQVPFVEHL